MQAHPDEALAEVPPPVRWCAIALATTCGDCSRTGVSSNAIIVGESSKVGRRLNRPLSCAKHRLQKGEAVLHMTDTPPVIAERARQKLMARSAEARFLMGVRMFAAARDLAYEKAGCPVLEEVRAVRMEVSARSGHDIRKMLADHRELQKQFTDRLMTTERPPSHHKAVRNSANRHPALAA